MTRALRPVMSARPRESRPDVVLLDAIAHGDLGALGELYDRYHVDLRRVVARTLASNADVDDVVHATFLMLPNIAMSFEGDGACRAWLCGVAVKTALRHRRSASRFVRMVTSFATTLSFATTRTPESDASSSDELRLVECALARLSAKKRAVFTLVAIEGLTSDQTAAALGIPVATVRTRLFHAKSELRAALTRGGQ
jgi:RNA polymerase sigma-70 factor (ECF subfamily)